MKTVKSLLLGAAAGFVALTGAQAADLPGKAAPAEYVRICDTYGAGFFFIPGTDTCLRIGGYVRMDAYLNQSFAASNTVYSTRTRLLLNFDARSNTEYGLLRAYGEFFIQRGPGNNVLPMNVAVGAGSTGQASAAYMSRAFIQFAGFTFGNSASFFNFYQGDLQFVASSGAAMDPSRNSSNLIAYTASFGSGFSATISVEDPQFRRLGSIATVTGGTPFTWQNPLNRGLLYSGQQMPDVVANLRVDQGWGSAQVMAAYHEVRGGAQGGAVFSKSGFAVGGGVRLNLDMLARGDVLWLQATYADGALGYVFTNDNSDGLIQTRQTIGAGLLTAVYADGALNATATGLVNSKAWGIHGGFRHFWTPALRSAIWGKYVNIDSPGAVAAGLVGDGAALNDIRFWQVGVNTIWSPVRNLDLGVEVVYSNLRSRDNGSGLTPAAQIGNASAWSGMFRVQRNF